MERNFYSLGFLNEFKISTGGEGGHFHISLGPPTEVSYYHFINRKGEVEDSDDRENKLTPKKTGDAGASMDKKLDRIFNFREDSKLEKIDIKPISIIEPEITYPDIDTIPMPDKLPWEELSTLEKRNLRQQKINKKKYELMRQQDPYISIPTIGENKNETTKKILLKEFSDIMVMCTPWNRCMEDPYGIYDQTKWFVGRLEYNDGATDWFPYSIDSPQFKTREDATTYMIQGGNINQQPLMEKKKEKNPKFNKKMIKEGIRDYLTNTVRSIKEKNRLKDLTNFEKQIYFYQKGYDVIDKRFKDYINDFRYYYSVVHNQELSHITNEEILRFLTKHYLKDIEPRLSGLYQHKILAHGTKDISSLDVVDIDKFIGSGSHNPGHFGKGFYLSSDRNVAKHYGATQPIVLNKVERPFYIMPGDKNYYGSHDFDGAQIRVKIDLANLPSEAIEMMDNKSHVYNIISDGKSYDEVGYAQGIPKLDKSWKQNGINDAKKDLEHKLKSHHQIEEKYIKDILDNAEIEIEPLKDFAGLTGSKTVDNVYNQGKHDLIVTNKNTSGVGHERFMDAEVAVKDPTQVVSLFPTYDIIIRSDLSSMDRDVTNPSIHSESITHPNKSKILYSAVVLDDGSKNNLLSYVSQYVDIPFDWKGMGEHMTIAFKEELPPNLKKDLGEVVSLTVKSIGISDDAIAVEVEGYPSQKEIPHITVAIPPDGSAVNSNNIEDWEKVEDQLIVQGKVSEIRT